MNSKQKVQYKHAQYYQSLLEAANETFASFEAGTFEKSLYLFDANQAQIEQAFHWLIKHQSLGNESAHLAYQLVSKAENILELRQMPLERIKWLRVIIEIASHLNISECLEEHYTHLANAHEELGNYAEAKQLYNIALDIAIKSDNKQVEGVIYGNLALLQSHQGNNQEALALYFRALNLARAMKQIRDEIVALDNIGSVYVDMGNYDEGLQYHNESLSKAQLIENRSSICTSLLNLANALLYQNKFEEAMQYFEQAITIAQTIPDDRVVGEGLLGIGEIFDFLDKRETALKYYLEAYERFKKLGNPINLISALNSLGTIYSSLGYIDQAIVSHQEALNLAVELSLEHERVMSLQGLGLAYLNNEDYEEAINYFTDTFTLATNLKNQSIMSACLVNLADSYTELEDYEKAQEYANRAIALDEGRGDLHDLSGSYRQLALINEYLEQPIVAIELYKKSYEFALRINYLERAIFCLGRIGRIEQSEGLVDAAKAHFAEALQLAKQSEDKALEAEYSVELAFVMMEMDDFIAALPLLKRAVACAKQADDPNTLVTAWRLLAESHQKLGKHRIAIYCFEKAILVPEINNDLYILATCQCYLARSYYQSNKVDTAEKFFTLASQNFVALGELDLAQDIQQEIEDCLS